MKKIFALLLAVALLCSVAVVAFAADSYTITITAQGTNHIYEAYQIFAGSLSDDGKLGNIVWGNGVNSTALLEALDEDPTFGTCTDAASFAQVLSDLSKDPTKEGEIKRFADVVGGKLVGGSQTTSVAVEGSTTAYTITVTEAGYYFIKDKDGSQTDHDAYTEFVLKVVKDVDVTAKMDVPEIEKKIEDTNDTTGVTSNWQDSADHDIGDTIRYQITVTLADNVSAYDTYMIKITDTMSKGLTYNNNAVVSIDDGDPTTVGFTFSPVVGENSTVLTISCDDVKELGATDNSKIVVTYTCTLNENAVVGKMGNPNTVNMEYSNNPNTQQGGEGKDTGKTPDDTVIAFTYKVVVNKVDENAKALTGAAFKLEKLTLGEAVEGAEPEATWKLVKEFELEEEGPTVFDFVGLDDGKYRLTETVTPDGYNTIDPIEFEVNADHEILSAEPKLLSLSGDPFTGSVDTGALSMNVVNNSGTILPGTGGMGTTLFYILGGILLLGAVVVLVSKKRVDAE